MKTLSYSPMKEDDPKVPRRVRDLNMKLVNMFDVYDEQQNLIKDFPNLNTNKGTSSAYGTPERKSTRFFSQTNLNKIKPSSSRGEKPEAKNFNIATITTIKGKFSSYRTKAKVLKTEDNLIYDQRDFRRSQDFRIISTNDLASTPDQKRVFFEDKPSPPEQHRAMTTQDSARGSQPVKTKMKVVSQKVEDTGFKLDNGIRIHNFTQKVSVFKAVSETGKESNSKLDNSKHHESVLSDDRSHSKPKLSAKPDEVKQPRHHSVKLESHQIAHLTASSSRKKSIFNELREKTAQIVSHADPESIRSEARNNKNAAVSTLRDVKVSDEQKQKLSNFLKNEFVEEIITNKHHAKNFYDGEAFTSLNNLKKVITSHVDVRNNLYGQASVESARKRRESQMPETETEIKEDIFPPDVPRLRQFELSEPDTMMLGIRPKSFITSASNYATTELEKRNSKLATQTTDEQAEYAEMEERTKKNLQSLKDAIDVQKARGKRIRNAIKSKLHKYSVLGISLKDLRDYNNIFPSKPYERKDAYPFIRSVKSGDYQTARAFLQENKYLAFDYDPIKQTALHWAAKRGHIKICTLLLENGADPDALDIGGKTPLYYALKERHPEVVGRLLFSKASPWSLNNVNYKLICDDGRALKYLNKARQLAILLMFYCAQDRAAVWEKEAKALIAPIDTPDTAPTGFLQEKK